MEETIINQIEATLHPKREKLNKFQMVFFIVLIISLLITLVDYRALFGLVPINLIFVAIIGYQRGTFRTEAKTIILNQVLAAYFDDLTYSPNQGLSQTVLRNTELYDMGNEFSANDLIIGKYQGIEFATSDVHLVQVTQNDKTTTRTTLFKGQWYIFDFFKNFNGYIQIRDKERRLLKRNYKPVAFFSVHPKTNRIIMDHPDFNRVFDVYTSDDTEAFYILTPHFMDALLRLNDIANCEVIVGFVDNRIHILINNYKNAFEINVFQTFTREKYQYFQAESEVIIELINVLKLETDLFK